MVFLSWCGGATLIWKDVKSHCVACICVQVHEARDLSWVCSSDDVKAGAYYVLRTRHVLQPAAQDEVALSKLWDTVQVQTGGSL